MAKVNLKPLGGNLLVKAIVEKSVSGIVLPDTIDKEKPQKGEAIALGTGKVAKDGKKIAFNVKVGDIVLFKKYSPDEVEVNGEDYLIMDEDAILAILS
ncbi:MAG TPA: co-chaperone GroES [Candidatus Dojkabacteria bacterium]|nr:co-chaperone GroES [Candidatus Dojkabacteria bacterium]